MIIMDLTVNEHQSIRVNWVDGKGVNRSALIEFDSGRPHGLLGISSAGESLAFIGEGGTLNEIAAMEYGKN